MAADRSADNASAMALAVAVVAAADLLCKLSCPAVLALQKGAAVGARAKPVGLPDQSSCCVVAFGLLVTISVTSCSTPAVQTARKAVQEV